MSQGPILPAILRIHNVTAMTGLSRSTVYNLISRDSFPAQVRLGLRASGWHRAEIETWLASRERGVCAQVRASVTAAVTARQTERQTSRRERRG